MAQVGAGFNTELTDAVLPILQDAGTMANVFGVDVSTVAVPSNFGLNSTIRVGVLDPDAIVDGQAVTYNAAKGEITEADKSNFAPINITMDKTLPFSVVVVTTDENYMSTFQASYSANVKARALAWNNFVKDYVESVIVAAPAQLVASKDEPLDWSTAEKLIMSSGELGALCAEAFIPEDMIVAFAGPRVYNAANAAKILVPGDSSALTGLANYRGNLHQLKLFTEASMVAERNTADTANVYPIYFGYQDALKAALLPVGDVSFWPEGTRAGKSHTVMADGLIIGGVQAAYPTKLFKAYVKLG